MVTASVPEDHQEIPEESQRPAKVSAPDRQRLRQPGAGRTARCSSGSSARTASPNASYSRSGTASASGGSGRFSDQLPTSNPVSAARSASPTGTPLRARRSRCSFRRSLKVSESRSCAHWPLPSSTRCPASSRSRTRPHRVLFRAPRQPGAGCAGGHLGSGLVDLPVRPYHDDVAGHHVRDFGLVEVGRSGEGVEHVPLSDDPGEPGPLQHDRRADSAPVMVRAASRTDDDGVTDTISRDARSPTLMRDTSSRDVSAGSARRSGTGGSPRRSR